MVLLTQWGTTSSLYVQLACINWNYNVTE
jgi:hypothetical protein